MSAPRDRYGLHPYGWSHQKLRKRFARRMRAGEVFYCWRPGCPTPGVPIDPRSWDLGHVDPELRGQFGTRWPEHRRCNRATITNLKRQLAEAAAGSVGGSSREW
jgi:hypothetical protein